MFSLIAISDKKYYNISKSNVSQAYRINNVLSDLSHLIYKKSYDLFNAYTGF